MRQIKFRGKSIKDGKWIYGSFLKTQHFQTGIEIHKIIPYDRKETMEEDIILETVCQFTGLYDIKGKEIYEGDTVRWGMHKGKETYHRYAVVQIDPDLQFKISYYIDSKTNKIIKGDDYIFHFGTFAYKDTHKHLEIL